MDTLCFSGDRGVSSQFELGSHSVCPVTVSRVPLVHLGRRHHSSIRAGHSLLRDRLFGGTFRDPLVPSRGSRRLRLLRCHRAVERDRSLGSWNKIRPLVERRHRCSILSRRADLDLVLPSSAGRRAVSGHQADRPLHFRSGAVPQFNAVRFDAVQDVVSGALKFPFLRSPGPPLTKSTSIAGL